MLIFFDETPIYLRIFFIWTQNCELSEEIKIKIYTSEKEKKQ